MKGDFTRFTHQPHQHYAGVLMQQGRVTLDADWNEQFDIEDHRWRVQTIDTIGRACVPVDNPGFGLTLTPDGTDLIISPGRMYIDGILVELDEGTAVGVESIDDETVVVRDLAPDGQPFEVDQWVELSSVETDGGAATPAITTIASIDTENMSLELAAGVSAHAAETGLRIRRVTTYLTQPYFPADAAPPFGDPFHPEDWSGLTHLAYLDVWRRHVTAIEDPLIREVALGGPDTAIRVQTVWSLRILRDTEGEEDPADASQIGCHDQLPAWDALIEPGAGRMSARAEPGEDPNDPCAIQPQAGYRGLENRLYRVEIHDPGPLGTATFKWSRDNGSILSSIVDFPAAQQIEVHSLGKDKVLRFHADDRVEVFSNESEFSGNPGTMASVDGAPDEADRLIDLDTSVSLYSNHDGPRVRRWDHGSSEIATTAAWVHLDPGVHVQFGAGPFQTGDYWVIPARVATGDVEGFIDAPPRGITHHFARVGIVTWPDADSGTTLDCRLTFPPLCELSSGDGDHCCTVSVGVGGEFTSLQAAVDSLEGVDGPARICVLPGEHRLPGTVVISRDELTISGCGAQSRIISTEGGALLIHDSSTVRVEDLTLFSASNTGTVVAEKVSGFEVIDCVVVNREMSEIGHGEDLAAPATTVLTATHGFEVSGPAGPALVVTESRGVRIRNNLFRGLPAVSLQGELLLASHNLAVGGGFWLRDGTESAEIVENTIKRGFGAGIILGGLADGEDPSLRRTGVVGASLVGNRISEMAREGISTALVGDDLIGEVEDLTIQSNDIRKCGLAPIMDRVALGGGLLLRDTTGVRIVDNHIENNGPSDGSRAFVSVGFGIALISCLGAEIRDNAIVDNGSASSLDHEGLVINAGIAALAVQGTEGAGRLLIAGPAAAIHGNVIRTPEGPGVLALAQGPVSINDNQIVSRYMGRSLLDFGRAVLVFNLGASPDIGFLNMRAGPVVNRLLHGRVQIHDNQITVQAAAEGLDPLDEEFQLEEADPNDLSVGSAVMGFSFDDLSIQGNQVLNEVSIGASLAPIRSSVWGYGSTVRTNDNRITERRSTALLSYFGSGMAHMATHNTTTHCMRVDGTVTTKKDNHELYCFKEANLELALEVVHLLVGG